VIFITILPEMIFGQEDTE